jgi:YfiH family protein
LARNDRGRVAPAVNVLESDPAGASRVRERLDTRVPALVHQGWAAELPWLVQGTTTRGSLGAEFDLGLFSDGSPVGRVRDHWKHLIEATGMRAAMHARQVHEADVSSHGVPPPGLNIVDPCDGHTTAEPGVLLAVTTADCVPVFLVQPGTPRLVGLLHAGWRGTAAGVLERGLARMAERPDVRDLRVHLGPAICGACYEVGPEVFEALGEARPARPTHLDLRAVLARRATAAGVDAAHVTVSEHCTRCTGSGLFSHRGGDRGRQVGYIGIRI